MGSVLTGLGSVLTAASEACCNSPATCQPAGTVIFDSGVIATEHTVNSNLAVGANSWIELPGLPFATLNPACSYKVIVTMDAVDIGPQGPTGDDGIINVFFSTPGALTPTDFDGGGYQLANVSASITTVYASYTLLPGTDTFNGPGFAISAYMWPGVNFPNFQGSEVKYKNLRIVVKAA